LVSRERSSAVLVIGTRSSRKKRIVGPKPPKDIDEWGGKKRGGGDEKGGGKDEEPAKYLSWNDPWPRGNKAVKKRGKT